VSYNCLSLLVTHCTLFARLWTLHRYCVHAAVLSIRGPPRYRDCVHVAVLSIRGPPRYRYCVHIVVLSIRGPPRYRGPDCDKYAFLDATYHSWLMTTYYSMVSSHPAVNALNNALSDGIMTREDMPLFGAYFCSLVTLFYRCLH
jgi:hypothetical protein